MYRKQDIFNLLYNLHCFSSQFTQFYFICKLSQIVSIQISSVYKSQSCTVGFAEVPGGALHYAPFCYVPSDLVLNEILAFYLLESISKTQTIQILFSLHTNFTIFFRKIVYKAKQVQFCNKYVFCRLEFWIQISVGLLNQEYWVLPMNKCIVVDRDGHPQ